MKQDIRWTARFDTPVLERYFGGPDELAFVLRDQNFGNGYLIDRAHLSNRDVDSLAGWLDSGRIVGQVDREVDSVEVPWVNLSDAGRVSGTALRLLGGESPGQCRVWRGREVWRLGDWEMTVDARPDLAGVVDELKNHGGHAVTHLSVLRRVDGGTFVATDVTPVLRAFHQAVAFALGREAAPGPASARAADGSLVWREWSVRRADQMGGVTAWWHPNACPMGEVTNLVGAKLLDPQYGRNASHILQGYVLSKRGGFVEQRITVGFSTIEQLCWQVKVFEEGVDSERYDKKKAAQRLRGLLVDGSLPSQPKIPDHLHVLQQFAKDEGDPTAALDGPAAVTEVRHRLVHPKSPADLYGRPGLLVEAWVLLNHYLELLILRWVGYSGQIQDTSIIDGWAGSVEPVPWS
ncbi:hypothetical protein [Frankia sp. EAN1pec]|uniref:hypothetical protein n=1 Tax=Parafrankia sp. (strain EAN1pec) TaxID=298653 RepID=UPI0012FA9A48